MNANHDTLVPVSASTDVNLQGLNDSPCSSAAQAPNSSWGEGIIHYVNPAKVDVPLILKGSIDAPNREAWDLKKKVEMAREVYDCEIPDLSHDISEAVCAVDCAEHDIAKLEARIRHKRSQTQKQTHELRDLKEALEEAKDKVVYYRERSQALFDDVRRFEDQLLHVMMKLQLRCHDPHKTAIAWMKDHLTMNGYIVAGNALSVPADVTGGPNLAVGTLSPRKVLINPPQQGCNVEGSPQNAGNACVQVDAPKKSPIQPLPHVYIHPTMPQPSDAAHSIKARSDEHTSDCFQHCALDSRILEPSIRPPPTIEIHLGLEKSKPDRKDTHQQLSVQSPVLIDAPVANVAAPATSSEPAQQENNASPDAEPNLRNEKQISADISEKKRVALQEFEQCENLYYEAGRKLDAHQDTYDEQWEAFYKDHADPSKHNELLEDQFALKYLHRTKDINAEHTLAKERMKAARLLAAEAGVELPNSYDQESDFLAVPGEGPTPSRDAEVASHLDRTRVKKWLHEEIATCKLKLVEAQFALSGSDVETWKSSSSRGDVVKRKLEDAEDDANKRRKVDSNTSRRLVEFREGDGHGIWRSVFERPPPIARQSAHHTRVQEATEARSLGTYHARLPPSDVPKHATGAY
ncbi:hypothetical protein BKA63DRAFT_569398 [Paraphoma chrysanthemicola]|nr:hypothetical protein BKA63DRAFT_569398 [Paraphoma chrysanthemicola]